MQNFINVTGLQVNQKLAHVDEMIGRLITGLQARNLLSCVNIILVADHGMVEAGQNRAIRLDQYIPNVINRTRFWSGIFGRMTPNDGREGKARQVEARRSPAGYGVT